MDFEWDETQRAIAAMARDVLAREADPESAWKALGHAGLADLGVVETAVVLYEVGRAAAALPGLSTLLLGQYGGLAAADRMLTAALRNTVTVAGNTVSGKAFGVWEAARAYRILVPVGATTYAVDPAADGVTLVPTYSASGAPEFTVVLRDMVAERAGEAAELHRFVVAGACAYGDGLLAGALDLTARHVRTREQFGKPLATFQAVAQQIADIYIAARTLHLAAWSACWRLGAGLDPDDDLAVAGYWLAAEALPALHTCHHLHGGLGVDASYPLHRYYSAVKDLVRLLGGAEHRLGLLGARIAS